MLTQEAITPTGKLILRELRDLAAAGRPDATVNQLTDATGACKSTVRKCLMRLTRLGEVTAEDRKHPVFNRPDATLYRLAD